jgi:hypothetical protein
MNTMAEIFRAPEKANGAGKSHISTAKRAFQQDVGLHRCKVIDSIHLVEAICRQPPKRRDMQKQPANNTAKKQT